MKNPWFYILIRPRQTIQEIVDYSPNYRLWPLAIIYSISSLLNMAQTYSWGINVNFYVLIFLIIAASAIWGYVAFNIFSFIIFLIGKVLQGKGSFKAVRAAFAWSNVPAIANLILWVFLFYFFRERLFKPLTSPTLLEGFIFLSVFITQVILSLWSLIIYICALAQVQQFSILRAILSFIFLILLFVAFVVGLFALIS